MRLAVIADDLTGAMDTGLQFAKRGLPKLFIGHMMVFVFNLLKETVCKILP